MNKPRLFLTILSITLLAQNASSQYYYNDIIVLKETNGQYQALRDAHITSVSAQNFESNDEATPNFLVRQDINRPGTEITTTTDIPTAGHSVSVNTYNNGMLAKTDENSTNIENSITYTYDAGGNVQTITTATVDTFMNSNSTEIDKWFYNGNSPAYMLHIKDNADTTVVEFVKDDQGNIAEEHWKKKGKRVEDYFYYYNTAHLLTDVVRFNNRAKRLLPDFLFEYDDAGRLAQLTQIQQNSASYLIWHYDYNSNALKQKETCYDKQKQLIGYIVYTYK